MKLLKNQWQSLSLLLKGKLRAAHRLVELVDAGSEHVALDASKHTLAIGGIKPAENGVNINVNNSLIAGYVVDLSEVGLPPVVDVTPESSS